MRREYTAFETRAAALLSIGPDSAEAFRAYWQAHDLPYSGLADPDHVVAKRYQQPWKLLKLGRMPMQLVVDREGVIRHRHDGTSMSDIPETEDLLAVLDGL